MVLTVANTTQEMSNPRIRPFLHFYPEACAALLKESWQFRRWLHELSSDLATPMIREAKQDYFVHEPATLIDGRVITPFRWFTRSRRGQRAELHGEGWVTRPLYIEGTDAQPGYLVHKHDRVTFPASDLLASFEHMVKTYQDDNKPDPRNIVGASLCGVVYHRASCS